MKITYLISLILLFTTTAWSQSTSTDSSEVPVTTTVQSQNGSTDSSGIGDTYTIKEEPKDHVISINLLSVGKRRVKTRFILFEMGINSYHHRGNLNIPASLETYELRHGRALEVNFHFYRQRIRVGKGHFNIEHGLSLDFNHYAFQNDVNYREDPVEELFIDNTQSFSRSRLRLTHLVLPVMFRFETNPKHLWRSFHLGVGAYGSLRVGANLRTKTTEGAKNKVVDNFGLNDFNAGMRAEIGYGPINLYVKYAFLGLFKEGQGPDLTPFSVGLILLPF